MKRLHVHDLAAAVFVFGLATTAVSNAAAQSSDRARTNDVTLSGSVHDSSGARIPRPTIVVRQEPSGLERVISGAADGSFTVRQLISGPYRVTASARGFGVVSELTDVPRGEPLRLTLAPAAIVEQVTVVSASRQEELREALNARVDVITRERIEETASQETVGEILRELPGVVTRRGSETAGAAGEQIQGIDSRQVLVLLDGQPLVGARGIKRGGIVNLDRQSTGRLERIEVVKGAASALYGSDALGGVINLITRQPSTPFDATFTVTGGDLGAVGGSIEAAFKREKAFGVFSAERHQHDGFDLTPTTFDTTGAPYRRHDALAKLQWQISPAFSLGGLATGYHNRLAGRSNGELGPQEDNVREHALNANVTGRWLAPKNTSIEARGYLSTYSENADGRLAPPRSTLLEPGVLDQRLEKFDVTVARPWGARQMMQAGLEWARDHYEGTNRLRDEAAGHQADTAVAWAQHRWSATSRLTSTVGVRVDRRSEFETAVSPKLAANFRVTSHMSARASYGRGFRAPDLGQLYYRFLSPSNFYQVIGNPELDPEYAHSWQIGGEFTAPHRRARLGVNFFRNDVRDLIDSVDLGFVATPAQLAEVIAREGLDPTFRPALGRLLLTYRNVADVVTRGIELDSEAALADSLSIGAAYTYLDAQDVQTGRTLTGRHPHHGHLRAAWQPGRSGFRASLRGTFFSSWIATRVRLPGGGVQDTTAPSFALWDAFISQRIVRRLSAFLTLDNITDSRDPNTGVLLTTGAPAPIYRPEAGRTVRVGVQWSLAAR